MHARTLALPLLAAATMISCKDDAVPAPTDLGVPWELAELRRSTISDVSYDVALTVPAARSAPIEGTTTVRFRWDDAEGRDVVLDFMSPESRVHSVSVNGKASEWETLNDHVVIPADALVPAEGNEVGIGYTAGDESLNRSDDFLYALFVPDRHHFSLPVFEQPNLKATWKLTLTVPAGWTAVSNGAEIGDPTAVVGESGAADASTAAAPSATGTRTFHFAETRKIPSYLFSFAAGRFQVETAERAGRTMRMFHRETDTAKVERNKGAIFDLHARALAWLEDYTEIPYPFDKFDFVMIPAFQYGGMEHPGSIFYRAEGMLLDPSATQSQYLGRASTISHETAHMWFGDLVTMNWFDDVWTKEVFANFMADKIVAPSFPELDHDLRFLINHEPLAYSVDRTAGSNAIRQSLPNLREAGTLYGDIIYHKAPVVMRQLEQRVGEDGFQAGLRRYLKQFSYGNATWPDLIGILDEGTSEDLAAWSRVWVEEPGRPTVWVERHSTPSGTTITLRPEDPSGAGRVWPQHLKVAVSQGGAVTFHDVELGGTPVTLELPDDPAWVLPEGGGLEYGRFELDDVSRAGLLAHVGSIAQGRVRGAAWLTLWDAVLQAEIPPADFLDRVLASLQVEKDEQITQQLLGYVGTVYWKLIPADERARRGPAIEAALWKGATASPTPTVKSAYFSAWRGMVETPEGVARLRRLWTGEEKAPVPLAEPDRTRLAETLALRGVEDWSRILDKEEADIKNPDRKARFTFVRPALSASAADRERFFTSLAEEANREREVWVQDGLGFLNHPLRAEDSKRFILPALNLLEEVQRTGDIFFPGRWMDAVLSGHTSPEAAETVAGFLNAHPSYPVQLKRKILQSSDMVERSARIVHGWGG
jgi:aminopeptidase N